MAHASEGTLELALVLAALACLNTHALSSAFVYWAVCLSIRASNCASVWLSVSLSASVSVTLDDHCLLCSLKDLCSL